MLHPSGLRPLLRRRSALTCLVGVLAAVILMAGCSFGSGEGSVSASLGTALRPVTFAQAHASVLAAYSDNDGLSHYTVKKVTYTKATRDKVLKVCHHGAAAADEQALQSGKIMACAPLIYYFYSYAVAKSSPAAMTAAQDLYAYAVTQIAGPVSTQATLNSLLRSWGVSVPDRATAVPVPSGTAGAKTRLVAAARVSMDNAEGVHLSIESRTGETTRTVSVDSGTTDAVETFTSGSATGHLLITSEAGYFSGNKTGLSAFFGMPSKATKKIGDSWVEMKRGTSQYTKFSAGTLIASLPSSVLPATDDVTVTRTADGSTPVYRLSWTAMDSQDYTTQVGRTLDLDTTGAHLPVKSTSKNGSQTLTVTYSNWGRKVTAAAPSSTIGFTAATK
ncbi:hypothetical protein AB0D74_42940 [Streptomyces sp. NPDC048278]|uniref:hypothetical protein n=1 Tax=Streptomyces sp. NPDC048278 TaxID=3155809 RepID=UPI00341DCAB1